MSALLRYITLRVINHKYDLHRKPIFADEACKPQLHDGVATFKLSLLEQDMLRCGITRVLNKVTVSCYDFFAGLFQSNGVLINVLNLLFLLLLI